MEKFVLWSGSDEAFHSQSFVTFVGLQQDRISIGFALKVSEEFHSRTAVVTIVKDSGKNITGFLSCQHQTEFGCSVFTLRRRILAYAPIITRPSPHFG